MRLVLIAVVALGAGCATTQRWHVDVPATEAGNACVRQCMGLRMQCLNTPSGDPWRCRTQEGECDLTCPGAKMVDDRP